MPYINRISRDNPSCFLFLVDQSGSMKKAFGGSRGRIKAQGVADAINAQITNLALKCTKADGVRDYFHVGVIGYGARIGPAFGDNLAGRELVPISEIADHPLRVEERKKKINDTDGNVVEQKVKFPVWIEPTAEGTTPMCAALKAARDVVASFLSKFPGCYPPVVMNITDGAATDGSPEVPATALRALRSQDGNVLLFNARLSSREMAPIEFPDSEAALPDEYARILYRMSSILPVRMHEPARREGLRVSDATRGFVFNADLASVIRFIDIGTQVEMAAPAVH